VFDASDGPTKLWRMPGFCPVPVRTLEGRLDYAMRLAAARRAGTATVR
jgi:hypothetical protein